MYDQNPAISSTARSVATVMLKGQLEACGSSSRSMRRRAFQCDTAASMVGTTPNRTGNSPNRMAT